MLLQKVLSLDQFYKITRALLTFVLRSIVKGIISVVLSADMILISVGIL